MTRPRDKDATKASLQAAILKVKDRGLPMSISAVAREASVTPSAIHKVYPDIAEEIRALMGRRPREQRDKKHVALMAANTAIRDLRAKVLQLERDLSKLASINYAQKQRIERLEAVQRGDVVDIVSRR